MWIWVIGFIVVVIVIIGSISGAASRTEEVQKKIEFNELAKTRVDAYVDYIRRTTAKAEFSRMTDLELKDMIGQKVRAYKSQVSGAHGVGAFILLAGVGVAIWLGFSEGSWGTFFVVGAIAVGGAVALDAFLIKRINGKLTTAGFDPERLKIEE